MVERISKKLPSLKVSSIRDKIRNIKSLFDELKVENTLDISPLNHYSPQNREAVMKILEGRGIPYTKN